MHGGRAVYLQEEDGRFQISPLRLCPACVMNPQFIKETKHSNGSPQLSQQTEFEFCNL